MDRFCICSLFFEANRYRFVSIIARNGCLDTSARAFLRGQTCLQKLSTTLNWTIIDILVVKSRIFYTNSCILW